MCIILYADHGIIFSWNEALPKFRDIVQSNRKGLFLATLPYKVGIASGVIAGIASIPMVFEINTVLWFNTYAVTTGELRMLLS
jgi:hypothetical protein